MYPRANRLWYGHEMICGRVICGTAQAKCGHTEPSTLRGGNLKPYAAPLQGKRYVLPNTTIMMHHPSGVARGQASDIQNEARELMRVRNYVNGVLSVATGQDQETVRSGPGCNA